MAKGLIVFGAGILFSATILGGPIAVIAGNLGTVALSLGILRATLAPFSEPA